MKNRIKSIALFFGLLPFWLIAQPVEGLVKIVVSPDRPSWEYKTGEPAKFTISVFKNQVLMADAKVVVETGPERLKPEKAETMVLKTGTATIDGGTMRQPGFLRCAVTVDEGGKKYRNLAIVGYDIGAIKPTVPLPADFQAFWQKGKEELAQILPDVKMVPLPERSSANTIVYHVSAAGYGNSRLYGILCVPRKPGKYPAVLQVPGAGIRPYNPDLEMADRGLIVFTIGIHGIPVNLDAGVYNNLNEGALKGYFFFNADHKDRYYYKRVYLNCVRAIDVIAGLENFDGNNLAVSGNSQGGALSIVTAALDKRVKYLAAVHPALCDLTGYLNGRAGGWPHIFGDANMWFGQSKAIQETMPYYDVVNFARMVSVPGYYTWGFNDEVCPPTSMYAAYNVITAPREPAVYHDSGHWMYPEQRQAFNDWIVRQLKK